MKRQKLYLCWGGCFALCAGLGCIPNPEGLLKAVMVLLSVLFFLPPTLLLVRGIREKNRSEVLLIRRIALLSLGVTLALLVANVLTARGAKAVGDFFYYLLVILSAPMVCGQYWVLSLFLWGCLLTTSCLWMPKK